MQATPTSVGVMTPKPMPAMMRNGTTSVGELVTKVFATTRTGWRGDNRRDLASRQREIVDRRHQGEPDDDPRHDAGEEQASDRFLRDDRVDHQMDAGRDHRADDRGAHRQRRREGAPVAGALHRRNADDGEPGGIRQRRAGNPREDHGRYHHHVAKAAAQMADERVGEIPDPAAQAEHIEQIAAEDEERDGEQGLAAHALEHELGDENEIAVEQQRAG